MLENLYISLAKIDKGEGLRPFLECMHIGSINNKIWIYFKNEKKNVQIKIYSLLKNKRTRKEKSVFEFKNK